MQRNQPDPVASNGDPALRLPRYARQTRRSTPPSMADRSTRPAPLLTVPARHAAVTSRTAPDQAVFTGPSPTVEKTVEIWP